jgi:hypothetical protein
MRYWAYLCAKLAVAGAVFFGLLVLLSRTLGRVPVHVPHNLVDAERVKLLAPLDDAGLRLWYDLALLGWFALLVVALFFIVHDQRYRCRVCLRKLRMPVETGSWGQMLQLGSPRIEYICPYGHGTLRADEVQISGLAAPEWTPQSGDIWEELCGTIIKDDPK